MGCASLLAAISAGLHEVQDCIRVNSLKQLIIGTKAHKLAGLAQ